jgi:myo-inositol-1(or 4)-monophosphatase
LSREPPLGSRTRQILPSARKRPPAMPASALMNVMISAARKAGRSLVRDFGEVENLQVSIKGPANFVTAADHRAEDIIYNELAKARPAYCFLMEERGEITGADRTHRWIVDPLDGTTNFLHGVPLFAVSIGLEREGQLVAGVVYNPATDEMFTAEKGKGAYLNDRRRLRVAARKTMADALVTTGVPHLGRPGHALFLQELKSIIKEVAGVRRTGSAALDLAWTSAGRFDAYWERGIKPWDMAAGILLVREAGGVATDYSGGAKMFDNSEVLAANATLHKAFLPLLTSAGAPA